MRKIHTNTICRNSTRYSLCLPCKTGCACRTGRGICRCTVCGSCYASSTSCICQCGTCSTSPCPSRTNSTCRTNSIGRDCTGRRLIGCSCYTCCRTSCTGRSICRCTVGGSCYAGGTSCICGCCTGSTSPCPCRADCTGCTGDSIGSCTVTCSCYAGCTYSIHSS